MNHKESVRLRLVGDGKEMDVPFSDAASQKMDGSINGKSSM